MYFCVEDFIFFVLLCLDWAKPLWTKFIYYLLRHHNVITFLRFGNERLNKQSIWLSLGCSISAHHFFTRAASKKKSKSTMPTNYISHTAHARCNCVCLNNTFATRYRGQSYCVICNTSHVLGDHLSPKMWDETICIEVKFKFSSEYFIEKLQT